jgi:hypothetical protein
MGTGPKKSREPLWGFGNGTDRSVKRDVDAYRFRHAGFTAPTRDVRTTDAPTNCWTARHDKGAE